MAPSQLPSRRFRFGMFAALYVAQGIGLAYFRNFQKPYLDGLGVDPDTIGLLTLILQLPFILKIFLGVLSDRVSLLGRGHRRPYIIAGQILAFISFSLAATVLPSERFLAFAGLVTLGSFSVTLFDSSTDGLAIDTTPTSEQGTVQGIMVAGRAAAFILMSLAFGFVVRRFGYRPVFPVIGVGMLLPLAWTVFWPESDEREPHRRFEWSAFRALRERRFLWFAAYAVIYSVGSFGVDGLVTYFMTSTFGTSEAGVGAYGAMRGIGAVAGALLGGRLLDSVSRRLGSALGVVAISFGAAAFGLATGSGVVTVVGLLWGLVWALQETVFFALAMDIADTRIAASMFAIMMAISNLGAAVADGAATALSDDLGFRSVFWALAAVNLATLPVLVGLFRVAPELATHHETAVS